MLDQDAFLRQEVESASPAKLRWLLLRKGVGLCQAVEQMWEEGRRHDAGQWLLRIRDILVELLDGVTSSANPASSSVSDLYVYLLKLLTELELKPDRQGMQAFREILEIELETWSLFLQKETATFAGFSTTKPHDESSSFCVDA